MPQVNLNREQWNTIIKALEEKNERDLAQHITDQLEDAQIDLVSGVRLDN